MKTNNYLYGKDVEVPEIPNEIIMRRVELLKEHLAELLDQSYHTRDTCCVRKVWEAIDFWEKINSKDK